MLFFCSDFYSCLQPEFSFSKTRKIFQHRDVHIFIADLSRSLALRVFCVAFRLGLYGNNFAWILPGFKISPDGTINNFWWQNNYLNIQTNCSLEEIEEVLTGHFALDQALIRPYEKGKEEILANGKVCFLFFLYFFDDVWERGTGAPQNFSLHHFNDACLHL